jgi:hypothetical protein
MAQRAFLFRYYRRPGYADAAVMAIAERDAQPVLTFDFEHFRATRPRRGYWQLVIDEHRYHEHTRPGRPTPERRSATQRTKGMSILVPAWYAGYAVGKVAVRFLSSTVAQ